MEEVGSTSEVSRHTLSMQPDKIHGFIGIFAPLEEIDNWIVFGYKCTVYIKFNINRPGYADLLHLFDGNLLQFSVGQLIPRVGIVVMPIGKSIPPIGILFARLLAKFFCLLQGVEAKFVVLLEEHTYSLGNALLLGYA